MHQHLIFFDSECPFCHKAVKRMIELDVHKRLLFAPLNGQTAKEMLTGPQRHLKDANSVILVENYDSTARRFSIRSQAILRTYWLTGDGWGLIGILSYLPQKIGDFLYKVFAEHRHQFKLKMPTDPGPKDRFLP